MKIIVTRDTDTEDLDIDSLMYKCNMISNPLKSVVDKEFYIEPNDKKEYNILYELLAEYIECQGEKIKNGVISVFVPQIGFLKIKEIT